MTTPTLEHDGPSWPAWFGHVRAAQALGIPLDETISWLRDRLAEHPFAAARLPEYERLSGLSAAAIADRIDRSIDLIFRTYPPQDIDGALVSRCSQPATHWLVLIREGLTSHEEVALYLHSFVHRLLGHVRDGDPYGHWDRLSDLSVLMRRWDREVADFLPPVTSRPDHEREDENEDEEADDSPVPPAVLDLLRPARAVSALNPVVNRLRTAVEAITEEEALADIWASGEDARLAEDVRFARIPFGRWRLAEQRLASDLLYVELLTGWNGNDLKERLDQLSLRNSASYIFDPDDPRFHRVTFTNRLVPADLPIRRHEAPPEASCSVPLLTVAAAAGMLGVTGEDAVPEFVVLNKPLPQGAFIVRIVGRSMEPVFPHGCYVVARPGGSINDVVLAMHRDFMDGDLGSFTIKRLTGQEDNWRLEADNPEYQGQPVLPEGASWDDVRIFARVYQQLSPTDFAELDLRTAQASRTPPLPLSDEDLQRRTERLQERRKRMSQPTATAPGTVRAGSEGELELVLGAEGRQLYVRIPALQAPLSVRYMEIGTRRILASNLTRPQMVPVAPRDIPYPLEPCGGAEAPPGLSLATPGLERTRATVFRAPAGSPGLRRLDPVLRAGRIYRLVVPPALRREGEALESESPWVRRLDVLDGWLVLEVDTPVGDDPAADGLLHALGLQRSGHALSLEMCGAVPARIDRTESGTEALVFDADEPPLLRVSAPRPCGPNEAWLLAAHEGGEERLELGQGQSWTVSLHDVPAGLVVLEARTSDRDVEAAQAAFRLERPVARPEPVPALVDVRLGDLAWALPGSVEPELMDLASAAGDLSISAPPLWPVEIRWGGTEGVPRRQMLRAGEDGTVDMLVVQGELVRCFRDNWSGWIDVDAGELGSIRIHHDGSPTVEGLVETLRRLAGGFDLQLAELMPVSELCRDWIHPVLRLLGYVVRPGESSVDRHLSHLHAGRLVDACWRKEQVGIVLVERAADGWEGAVQRESRRARTRGTGLVVLTDGVTWTRVDASRFLLRTRTVDLRNLLEIGNESDLQDFVEHFAA